MRCLSPNGWPFHSWLRFSKQFERATANPFNTQLPPDSFRMCSRCGMVQELGYGWKTLYGSERQDIAVKMLTAVETWEDRP